MVFVLVCCAVAVQTDFCVCLDDNCSLCSGGFEHIVPEDFNLSEIQEGIQDEQIQVVFVNSPHVLDVEEIKKRMRFRTIGPAEKEGVLVKCPDLAAQDDKPGIVFESFTFVMSKQVHHRLAFNNVTFENCSFVKPKSPYEITANWMSIDSQTLMRTDSEKFKGMKCDVAVFAPFAPPGGYNRKFVLAPNGKVKPSYEFRVDEDASTVFQRSAVVFNVSGMALEVQYSQGQEPELKYEGSGNHVFTPATDLDENWGRPSVTLKISQANITLAGGWPASTTNIMSIYAVDQIDVHLLGSSAPIAFLSYETKMKSFIHLYSKSVTIAGRILLNQSTLSIVSNVEASFTASDGIFYDSVLELENPAKMMLFFQNSQFVHGAPRITGNVTVCPGKAYFGRLGDNVSIPHVHVRRGDVYTMEFGFQDNNLTIENALLTFESITFESDDVLVNFLLRPGFTNIPNPSQMTWLLNSGFDFLKGGEIPNFDKIDFNLPADGPKWFNAQTNLFYLEQRKRTLSARILELPHDYPEFVCIASDPSNDDLCRGYNLYYESRIPTLCDWLRDADELRVMVALNQTKHKLELPCFADKPIQIEGGVPDAYILYADQWLNNVVLKNLRIDFTHSNVIATNLTLTNCQIANETYMLNGQNILVDIYTMSKSNLVFTNVTLQDVLSETTGSIAFGDDEMHVNLTDRPLAVLPNKNIQGRLKMVLNCTKLTFDHIAIAPSPAPIPGFNLTLVSDCAIDYGNMSVTYKNKFVIDHGDKCLNISNSPEWGVDLVGTGNITFTDNAVLITEKAVYNAKQNFFVKHESNTITWNDIELASGADINIYAGKDSVALHARKMTVTGDAKVASIQLHKSLYVAPKVFVAFRDIIGPESTMELANYAEANCGDVKLANVTIRSHASLECANLTTYTQLTVESEAVITPRDFASLSNVTLIRNAALLAHNLSFSGDLFTVYDMFAYPVVDAMDVDTYPEVVTFYYEDNNEPLDFRPFLDVRHTIISSWNLCHPSTYIFDSRSWYFQGKDPVMSVECSETLSIYLARLPQPYPTRHVHVTVKDALFIVFLGGAGLAVITGLTVFFALKWKRELAQLDERYDPFNTSLL